MNAGKKKKREVNLMYNISDVLKLARLLLLITVAPKKNDEKRK